MDKHQAPWNLSITDKKYQEEPWILKKGKDSVTIQRSNNERVQFNLKKTRREIFHLIYCKQISLIINSLNLDISCKSNVKHRHKFRSSTFNQSFV